MIVSLNCPGTGTVKRAVFPCKGFLWHEAVSPGRSVNQPKATRVYIRSINQSNRSTTVRFHFRSYKNRSN